MTQASEAVFAYGVALGTVGTLATVVVCIAVADRISSWRRRRRMRRRGS